MRVLGIVALCAALGGCAAAPKMLWLRADGQHIRDNAVYAQQFEMDGTVCLGERSKANLSGVTFAGGGLSGIAAAQNRSVPSRPTQFSAVAWRRKVICWFQKNRATPSLRSSLRSLKKSASRKRLLRHQRNRGGQWRSLFRRRQREGSRRRGMGNDQPGEANGAGSVSLRRIENV